MANYTYIDETGLQKKAMDPKKFAQLRDERFWVRVHHKERTMELYSEVLGSMTPKQYKVFQDLLKKGYEMKVCFHTKK